MVVLTSLLVPFTLPSLVGLFASERVEISLLSMTKLLGLVIFAAINLGVFSKFSGYFYQKPGIILSAKALCAREGKRPQ